MRSVAIICRIEASTVTDMNRLDVFHKMYKSPKEVALSKLAILDEELQKKRQKKHVMSKREFRERLIKELAL